MNGSSRNRPIRWLGAHAAEFVRHWDGWQEPLVVAKSGQAGAALQGCDSSEQTQEVVELGKILTTGNRRIAAGRAEPATRALRPRQRAGKR
jgi:hypothetical protein